MVAEVDLNPLLVSSPDTVTFPFRVGMVADGAFNPPATSIYPKTVLVLFLHSTKLAVWVDVEDWIINPLVDELDVRMWRAEAGVDVLIANLVMLDVAYISVPLMIHLVSGPNVDVEYLFPCPSSRLPDTARYPVNVMFVPDALVNLNAVMVVDADLRSSAVRAPLMTEIGHQHDSHRISSRDRKSPRRTGK